VSAKTPSEFGAAYRRAQLEAQRREESVLFEASVSTFGVLFGEAGW
jgi:hypothetical protein